MAQNTEQDRIRRKKRKKLLKLRKNRLGCSVIAFMLSGLITLVLLALVLQSFFLISLSSKIESEYASLQMLANMYQADVSEGKEDAIRLLDLTGRPYLLKEADGTLLYQNGENTCGTLSGSFVSTTGDIFISIATDPTPYTVYEDTKYPIMVPDSRGYITVDWAKLMRKMTENPLDEQLVTDDTIQMDSHLLLLPLWIEVTPEGGTQRLIFRTELTENLSELILLIIILLAMLVTGLFLSIILLHNLISDLIRQHKVKKLFFTDIATKGHNWMWFLLRGEILLHKARRIRYAVAEISVVKYRTFCVCNSIAEGEQLLGRIQNTLLSRLEKKEICAHSADGSFAMLLRYTDDETLRQRIRQMMTDAAGEETGHSIAFHTGVNVIPESAEKRGIFRRNDADLEKEYNNACAACATLEHSDDSGIAFFDEKLVEEQKWIDTVLQEQQSALQNEEFVVFYQPKYDPRTNQLSGAEALIRWQSPKYGFISPGKFIPIFEKNGFITEIDHYMIAHAARDQRRWLNASYHCVPVSVNVSRAHFIESDLAEQIRDIVDAEGTPHELIEIELTESAFFDDKKALIRTISRLKSYGFTVSMDDFGSGYSSLNSLKDMPLDILKLDAEFFRGETAGTDRGEIIVTEAIRLAKSLNMRTVAEGVEIKEQVDFLAAQGCDMIQGYYFAKPMPGNEFEQRIAAPADPLPEQPVSET